MESYDTIIIGAGLSGCALGKLLLEKNQKVLIIEKNDIHNKSKLCGGLITTKAYKLLKLIYGEAINDLDKKEIKGFEIKNEGLLLRLNDSKFWTVFRENLDFFVLEEYSKKGGKIIDKTIYERIDFKNKILYVDGEKYKYKNLVGADGIFSQVRRDLTGKQQEKNFALEAYIPNKNQSLQINFLNHLKGYTWIIPNPQNTVLGIGDVSKNTNLKNDFMEYFHLNERETTIKGAFLPTGKDILLDKKGVYFLGDAAGLISPITGEGIYYALISAYHLSNTINSHLYRKLMKREVYSIQKHMYLKKFVYCSKLRNYLFSRYSKSKFITKHIDDFARRIL